MLIDKMSMTRVNSDGDIKSSNVDGYMVSKSKLID